MGFETVILTAVSEHLGNAHQAEFTNGSLFVSGLSFPESSILREILENITTRKVQVSAFGHEFAFDFTDDTL